MGVAGYGQVRVHFRFLAPPPANLAAAIVEAEAVLALAGLELVIKSQETLVAPEYLSIDVETDQDEELYELGLDGVGNGETVIYFVEEIFEGATPFKGWALLGSRTMGTRINSCRALIAEGASDYILAHELCHNLGLEHVVDTDNIMYPITGDITNLPPDLTSDQILTMRRSSLTAPEGWNVVNKGWNGALFHAILYRFAEGDEAGSAASFPWVSDDAINDVIVGRIRQFRYVDPDIPISGMAAVILGDITSLSMPTVVTDAPNSLAVAVASMSDNVSASGPSGEEGGAWDLLSSIASAATADGASDRIATAPIAVAGTITGGTMGLTPSGTEVSEDSIIRGLALRGLPVAGGHEQVQPFAAFATVYTTRAGPWRHSHDELILRIQDLGAKLQDRLQILTYAGTGGSNGPPELAGRTRPLGIGRPKNVPLQLVDTANFVFQANAGAISAVDDVFDRGVALASTTDHPTFADLAAASVSNGTYATCRAEGYIKVGGGADPGSVTANIAFDATVTHSSAIRRIVVDLGPLVAAEADEASFTALSEAQPGEIGAFFRAGEEVSLEQAVEMIAASGGLFAGQDGNGLYRVQLIDAPSTTPHWAFDERSIVFESGLRLSRREPPYEVPWKSWGLGYDRNWTVQQGANLATGLDPARRIYLESEYRYVYGQNAQVALAHGAARSIIKNTLFVDEAAAAEEAARLAALYGKDRAVYEVPVKTALFSVRVGQTVRLTYPRFGLNQGKNFVVIGVDDDGDNGVSLLVVFG